MHDDRWYQPTEKRLSTIYFKRESLLFFNFFLLLFFLFESSLNSSSSSFFGCEVLLGNLATGQMEFSFRV